MITVNSIDAIRMAVNVFFMLIVVIVRLVVGAVAFFANASTIVVVPHQVEQLL